MALIGDTFDSWVTSQINKRQEKLGEGITDTRSLDGIKVFNQSSPWIRLTSGVSINQPTEEEADSPGVSVYDTIANSGLLQAGTWEGNLLSRNFILSGGVTNESGTGFAGINKGQLKSSYGFGYTSDGVKDGQGYVPMPGITSAEFEYKNDGALAVAKINVKAYSKAQFQIIDILFQRPGYTCLLEFGHSTFLDNSGNIQYAGKGNYSFATAPFNKILNAPSKNNNYFQMAKLITAERKKWHGNYEAFFGKITKFNWKFNEDGTYDITVNLVGTGDVISSLRVNAPKITLLPYSFTSGAITKPSEKDREEAQEEGAAVIADALASQLNFELFACFRNPGFRPSQRNDMTIPNFPLGDSKKRITIKNAVYKTNVAGVFVDYDPQTWVKFGALLAMLQKTVNIKDNDGNYLLSFDFNFEDLKKDTNFMATFPGNFSSNPNKVVVPWITFPAAVGNLPLLVDCTINNELGWEGLNNNELPGVKSGLYRRLADVYVNVNFIAETLQQLRSGDPESKDEIEVPLLDFLKRILEAINTCLGGINNFRVLFDENENKIKIVSETPIISKKTPSPAIINTFGLIPDQGSFVKNVDLSAELTDKMATQISVGAQSGGNKNGIDGTSFSIYNKGLVDRLMVKKKTAVEEDTTTFEQDKEQEKDFFEEMWDDNTQEAFREIYEDSDFSSDYVTAMENIVSNIATKAMGYFVQTKQSQATFFLPFNLSLTMHGLSGMKIYQAFQTTGRELPLSYNPKQISLIIKSYSHSVSLDGWTTKISTMAKPLFDVDPSDFKPGPISPPSPPPPAGGSGGGGEIGEGGQTIPSGYPVGKIYYEGPTNKIQIYIHHTAGWQNIKQVVAGWNTRTDKVSTVFVTNNAGEAERLYPDEAWGNHLGLSSAAFASVGARYQNLNKITHGIEMCSIGGLKLKNGKYYCYPNNYNTEYKNGNVQRIVDKNGKDGKYKGFEYCEGFTDVHIRNVYNIVTAWKSKYGITYTYNFDDLFPPTGKLSANALKGVKGIYTHNSVRSDKLDVMPTKKILDMFKSLAD